MKHYLKVRLDEKRLIKALSGVALYRNSFEFGNNAEAAV